MRLITTKAAKISCVLTAALIGGTFYAQAGGFERSSQDFDILFEEGNLAESGVTYVMPQRKLKNIRQIAPDLQSVTVAKDNVNEGKSYWVPKVSARFQLNDDLACAAQYRRPWGIVMDVGTDTLRAYSSIEQEISSHDFGLNCSYRLAVGEKGFVRLLGGLSYQELSGYQTKLLPNQSIATLDVDGRGYGWRLGAAYEVPEIALRGSVVYQSKVKYDLNGTIAGVIPTMALDVGSDVSLPQSVEFKFQTGIAPDWVALASVKWTDWKSIQVVPFTLSDDVPAFGLMKGRVMSSLDLYFRDGWTVSGGVAHKFNDHWSGAATLTWDRGTSTGWTSQTDVWLLGAGANYKVTDHFDIKLSGALGLLRSGEFHDKVSTSDFGTDLVKAFSVAVKLKL
ncbi:OmpP1/FadL family transporter [Paenochrobactrum sp. BZR 588]|uniref:OmpP1/FadL family transporter n=1 Tax=unclassified Paenochrobactrum TaxID=2639760 RepID=UPI003852BBD7